MQKSTRTTEEATVAVQFTDLPNALIACKVAVDLFDDGGVKSRCANANTEVVPIPASVGDCSPYGPSGEDVRDRWLLPKVPTG
ncbi:unnamed protein product [Boreogadus saida]